VSKKPRKAPIYATVRQLFDEQTGQYVIALVPKFQQDRAAMAKAGYAVGTLLRAELKAPRNTYFHRLAHVLGKIVVDNLEQFKDLTPHAALKKLQGETGVSCETIELDLGPFGKHTAHQPKSMAFDEMDETEFRELIGAIYRHIATKYWPAMTAGQVEQMVLLELGAER